MRSIAGPLDSAPEMSALAFVVLVVALFVPGAFAVVVTAAQQPWIVVVVMVTVVASYMVSLVVVVLVVVVVVVVVVFPVVVVTGQGAQYSLVPQAESTKQVAPIAASAIKLVAEQMRKTATRRFMGTKRWFLRWCKALQLSLFALSR